jgi:cytochrome c oxidase assembly factor CtaG
MSNRISIRRLLLVGILTAEVLLILFFVMGWLYYVQAYSWGDKHANEQRMALYTIGAVVLLLATATFIRIRNTRV